MSNETDNVTSEQQGTSEELSSALGTGGDTEFVATEEKKPVINQGMLYLLLLLAIGGGGTYFMYKKGSPDTAAAATPESAKAQETINSFLAGGPNGMKMMEQMLRNTEKVVQQFLEYPTVTQIPLSALHTNPFRLAGKPEDPKNPDDEASRKRETEKTLAMRALQGLNLQSIIHSGKTRACMINNTMYQEGQQIDQFTIEKISAGAVIVKTPNFRFELKMQK